MKAMIHLFIGDPQSRDEGCLRAGARTCRQDDAFPEPILEHGTIFSKPFPKGDTNFDGILHSHIP
jgi:hypothetical protein